MTEYIENREYNLFDIWKKFYATKSIDEFDDNYFDGEYIIEEIFLALSEDKKPNEFIEITKERILEEYKTFDNWKNIFHAVMDFLSQDTPHLGEFIHDPDIYVVIETCPVDLVENCVDLAIWIFENAYNKFGKSVVNKTYKKYDDELISWVVHHECGPHWRKNTEFIFVQEDRLIRELDPRRIIAANKIRKNYINHYYNTKNVVNRYPDKVRNLQGYYYDIDLIEPDIFN